MTDDTTARSPTALLDILHPPALVPGDRVAVVAPASPVVDRLGLEAGLDVLERWGYEPVVMPHVHDAHGHLAGTDAARAADLDAAFHDPAIRAVWAARGGYGSSRVLDLLDWQALRRDPKLLVGFSDVTALLVAAWTRLGLVGIHGQFVGRLALQDESALGHLRRLLTGIETPAELAAPEGATDVTTVAGGAAEGRLLGGNLALLCSLVGTPDEPDPAGTILFFEDVSEAPYRLDRMLVHLLRAGWLDEVEGIVVGELRGCDPPPDRPSSSPADVVADVLGELGVPVIAGCPIGHVDRQIALPFGALARLDADAGVLTLLETPTVTR